jgi:multimeric flavodoxin WrbA
MNIVIISGSYRRNGSTSKITEAFIKGVKSVNNNVNVEILELIENEFDYCKGCMSCMKDFENSVANCLVKDGLEDFLKRAVNSDLLVLASPIYEGYVTSIMKKFMERTLVLSTIKTGRPKARNKVAKNSQGVVLLASGVPSPINHIVGITKAPRNAMMDLLKTFGKDKITSLIVGDALKDQISKEKNYKKAFDLGIKVVNKFQ